MRNIKLPYLLFLGDADASFGAKTAEGVLFWRPEQCVGQMRWPGCEIDLGIEDLDFDGARAAGAQTLLIGVTNRGGVLPAHWVSILVKAVAQGFDIASGLHQKLNDIAEIADAARFHGRTLHDVRHWPGGPMPLATGERRSGRRVLMVGTDCAVGKKFSALAIHQEMAAHGLNASFRPTGQTGLLIAGEGAALDAIPGDFIAGVAEALSPANDGDHWDVIEGQASVLHPTFGGVTLGLVHGSQPDALVLCHQAGRETVRGLPGRPLPSIADSIEAHLAAARVTNAQVRWAGISLNTKGLSDADAQDAIDSLAQEHSVPVTDPVRFGASALVDCLITPPTSPIAPTH